MRWTSGEHEPMLVECSECGHEHFDPSRTGPGHPGGDYVPCEVEFCTCPYKNPNPYRWNLQERQATNVMFAQSLLDAIKEEADKISPLLIPLSIEALQVIRDRLADTTKTLVFLKHDIKNKEI